MEFSSCIVTECNRWFQSRIKYSISAVGQHGYGMVQQDAPSSLKLVCYNYKAAYVQEVGMRGDSTHFVSQLYSEDFFHISFMFQEVPNNQTLHSIKKRMDKIHGNLSELVGPDGPLKCGQTLSVPNPLHMLQKQSAVFHLHTIAYSVEGFKYGIIVGNKCTISVYFVNLSF